MDMLFSKALAAGLGMINFATNYPAVIAVIVFLLLALVIILRWSSRSMRELDLDLLELGFMRNALTVKMHAKKPPPAKRTTANKRRITARSEKDR